jgi:PAS fold
MNLKEELAEPVLQRLSFDYLPAFAAYIKENYLVDFAEELLRLSVEVNMPLLRYLKDVPRDVLIKQSIESATEYLTNLVNNKVAEHMYSSLNRWKENRLGTIDKYQLEMEDISLLVYVRKRAFNKFLPSFAADVETLLRIIEEIDRYHMQVVTAANHTYQEILQERTEEQHNFIKNLFSSTPGIGFIYDITGQQVTIANRNFEQFFGTFNALTPVRHDVLLHAIHPDDVAAYEGYLEQCAYLADGEMLTWEMRIRALREDNFIWMRAHVSPYKRDDHRRVVELIGFLFDVDREKKIAADLADKEYNLRQAQTITHLGSWALYVKTGKITWSDELFHIYGIAKETPLTVETVMAYTHPEDKALIKGRMEKYFDKPGKLDIEYRIIRPSGEVRTLHAITGIPRRKGRDFQNNRYDTRRNGKTGAHRAITGERKPIPSGTGHQPYW